MICSKTMGKFQRSERPQETRQERAGAREGSQSRGAWMACQHGKAVLQDRGTQHTPSPHLTHDLYLKREVVSRACHMGEEGD